MLGILFFLQGCTGFARSEPPRIECLPGEAGSWIVVHHSGTRPVTVRVGGKDGTRGLTWFADPPVFELDASERRLIGRSEEPLDESALELHWVVGHVRATPDPDVPYRLPLRGEFACVGGFGEGEGHRGRDFHSIDLACPEGTPVHAARSGVVLALREDVRAIGSGESDPEEVNFVRVLHADGTFAIYLHLASDGVEVELGERVHTGQRLAVTGRTGRMAAPHLHFCVARADLATGYRTVAFRFAGGEGPGVPRRGQRVRG